jgi:hypothetical protein
MTKSALTTCTPDRQDCLPAGPPARLWPMDGPTIDEFMALSEPQKDALVASWPLDLCEASAGMSSVQTAIGRDEIGSCLCAQSTPKPFR